MSLFSQERLERLSFSQRFRKGTRKRKAALIEEGGWVDMLYVLGRVYNYVRSIHCIEVHVHHQHTSTLRLHG